MSRRVSQRKVYNTFTRGLVTEATELNFPENASSDELNFRLLPDGSRKRRKGFDVVNPAINAGTVVFDNPEIIYKNYEWRNVFGRADLTFIVVQTGKGLFFYKDSVDIANNRDLFAVIMSQDGMELDTGTTYTDLLDRSPCQFSDGDGRLFVANKYTEPFTVLYNADQDSWDITVLTINERDFKGLVDGLSIEETPPALSLEHDYNLQNQGWGTKGGVIARDAYQVSTGNYPANTMTWRYGKIINPSTGVQEFNIAHFEEIEFGNSPAPKGHFVVNAFSSQSIVGSISNFLIITWTYDDPNSEATIDIGAHTLIIGDTFVISGNLFTYARNSSHCHPGSVGTDPSGSLNGTYSILGVTASTVTISIKVPNWENYQLWCDQYKALGTASSSGASVITNEIPVRPSATGFFAGRAFWSGVDYSGYANKVWFSQIMDRTEDQAGDCYQQADPTSEFINELVDTDGGVVVIQGMGRVFSFEQIGASILVLCSNGVWEITGGDLGYFTAKSIKQSKVTTFPCISSSSIVNAGDRVAYWSEQGIVVLSIIDSGGFSAEVVTDNTIKQKYLDIVDKKFAAGRYNKVSNTIVWVYSNTGDGYQHKFNRVLTFDLKISAIYEYNIEPYGLFGGFTDANYVTGVTVTDYYDTAINHINLTMSLDTVAQFGSFNNDLFLDFSDWDGIGEEQPSYLEAGYEILGSPSLNKQSEKVSVFFNRTEKNWIDNGSGGVILDNQSGCVLSGKWDFADTGSSGKISKPYQIYNLKRLAVPISPEPFDNGYPVTQVNVSVRGSGVSLTLRFDSVAGKDCHILGWTNLISGETEE